MYHGDPHATLGKVTESSPVGCVRAGRDAWAPAEIGMIVAAAARNDQDAWNVLVSRFTGLLWSIARGFRLDDATAADAVQTTWLRLVDNLDRIAEPEAIGGWLATTMRRECLHVVSRSAREVPSTAGRWRARRVPGRQPAVLRAPPR